MTSDPAVSRPRRTMGHFLRATLVVAVVCGLSACRGERSDAPPRQFFPDMDDSPKWKPQDGTDFFADGRTMRPRVEGTVAFGRLNLASDEAWAGRWRLDRERYLRDDAAYYEGIDERAGADAEGQPVYVAWAPDSVIERRVVMAASKGRSIDGRTALGEMLARGQERYNIFCAACHGYQGDGQGLVGQRWSYPIPSFHDPRYKDRSEPTGRDGYIHHVIRYGIAGAEGAANRMPAYKDKVPPEDAWAIVLYVRALQDSWIEDVDRVPAEKREELERTRPGAPARMSSSGAAGETEAGS